MQEMAQKQLAHGWEYNVKKLFNLFFFYYACVKMSSWKSPESFLTTHFLFSKKEKKKPFFQIITFTQFFYIDDIKSINDRKSKNIQYDLNIHTCTHGWPTLQVQKVIPSMHWEEICGFTPVFEDSWIEQIFRIYPS